VTLVPPGPGPATGPEPGAARAGVAGVDDGERWLRAHFVRTWAKLEDIGRGPGGGYTRPPWGKADAELRQWFRDEAGVRGMPVEQAGNGNLWAWWGEPGASAAPPGAREHRALAIGSHLDSVPDGGAFDGPLGLVCSYLAIDVLRSAGGVPVRPIAVVCWADEEGARFGAACAGSRLLTGALSPGTARALVDDEGVTMAEAMQRAGADPALLGPDPARLASLLAFVELHIEQGRRLVDLGAPVGIATAIWPHGRWRCSFRGEPNHAGTTLLADRHDPMLPFAAAVIEAREIAEGKGGRATFAKVVVWPNATNAVAARVDAWLDARAPDEPTLKTMVAQVGDAARRSSAAHGVQFELLNESLTGTVEFEQALRTRLVGALGNLPQLPTAAGHDAGTLSACVPTAMLFVRNPTGTSHSPAEWASADDCVAGARALARVLEELACR